MNWRLLLEVLDFLVLVWIAEMERQSLLMDKLNHSLFSTFFIERARWYAARNKQKAPETTGGNELIEVVREDDSLVES
jgi:hypothetical protein